MLQLPSRLPLICIGPAECKKIIRRCPVNSLVVNCRTFGHDSSSRRSEMPLPCISDSSCCTPNTQLEFPFINKDTEVITRHLPHWPVPTVIVGTVVVIGLIHGFHVERVQNNKGRTNDIFDKLNSIHLLAPRVFLSNLHTSFHLASIPALEKRIAQGGFRCDRGCTFATFAPHHV